MPTSNDDHRPRRILFITPQMPYPPEQGTALRNYHLIAQVAQQHEVSLLSFVENERPASPGPLAQLCRRLVTVPAPVRSRLDRLRTLVASAQPDMAHRLRCDEFAQALLRLLAEDVYDVLQVEGIELAPYALRIARQRGYATPGSRPAIVYDAHNAEYLLQMRAAQADARTIRRWPVAAYSAVQWRRLAHLERRICRTADAVLAVSEADARSLQRLVPEVRPLVIPNGVDVERYHPNVHCEFAVRRPAVVYTGKMDFRPNVDAMLWFHRRVWPLVRAEIPEAHCYVVGKSPHPRLAPLQADPTVTVTGYVEDVLPYFAAADAYVVPLRVGGGTRLKVLEALAAGRPLVTTSLGAEGIALRHEEHALIADQPVPFARAVVTLLRDRERAAALGRAGRQLALELYDWRRLVPPLCDLYCRISPLDDR